MGRFANESGRSGKNTFAFKNQVDKRTGFKRAVDVTKNVLGAFNERSESVTRFAEYLTTIDRLGDTAEGRLQGIADAAEVTVDFSRHGSMGRFINAWIPYWNPAVQGIDKVIRSVVGDEQIGKEAAKQGWILYFLYSHH